MASVTKYHCLERCLLPATTTRAAVYRSCASYVNPGCLCTTRYRGQSLRCLNGELCEGSSQASCVRSLSCSHRSVLAFKSFLSWPCEDGVLRGADLPSCLSLTPDWLSPHVHIRPRILVRRDGQIARNQVA